MPETNSSHSKAAQIYVGLVGLLYIGLGVFCALAPERASNTVGLIVNSGSGSSEFLAVYGGLEIGMGLAFLLPIIQPLSTKYALQFCLLIHLAIVVCRTIGFFLFENTGSGTIKLAAGEWIIFVAGVICWLRARKVSAEQAPASSP